MTDFRKPYCRQSHKADCENHLLSGTDAIIGHQQPSVRFGPEFSKHLGVVCHFYADFFCFPHTPTYGGTYWQHIKYEWALFSYMRKSFAALCLTDLGGSSGNFADTQDLADHYEALRQLYRSSPPSYKTDVVFALRACLSAVTMITRAAVMEPASISPVISGP